MRHRRKTNRLSRNTSSRKALLRGLVTHLVVYERIRTTHAKAKEAGILADKIIRLGKENTPTSKKTAISILGSKAHINKIFDDIAPRYSNRKGGYTRVLRLGSRKGDGAEMALLEFTERKITEKAGQKRKKSAEDREASKPSQKAEKNEERPEVKEGAEKTDEKRPAEKRAKEKIKPPKTEEKKHFFKGLKKYFRKKSP